jgi:hypothetical protein
MKKIIAILLCVPTMVMAEFYTGNQLLTKMRSSNTVERSLALGYILGVTDAHHGLTHCAPANVTAGQINDMVKQTLEEIPSIRNNTADIIIQGVLSVEWPCNHGKKGKAI